MNKQVAWLMVGAAAALGAMVWYWKTHQPAPPLPPAEMGPTSNQDEVWLY